MKKTTVQARILMGAVWLLVGLAGFQSALAQSDVRLEKIPGYEKSTKIRGTAQQLVRKTQTSGMAWSENGQFLNFRSNGKRLSLNLNDFTVGDYDPANKDAKKKPQVSRRGTRVARAQQRKVEVSPDEKWNATFRDNNVWLVPGKDNKAKEIQVTSDGHDRLRYGTCCWVYGEELDQDEAMWWSPDGKKLVFYEVNEEGMRDYHLTTKNTGLYTELKTVRYPKAGDTNPKVAFLIYDMESGETKRIKVDGDPTQYLYDVQFSPDGSELIFHRTNRHQNVLDLLAANVETGETRVILTENQSTWQNNSPTFRFLEDGKRFVWATESNGWRHFQLRHLDGRLLNPLSQVAEYPCESIYSIDEEAGYFYYTAYSDENPYNLQLHRVRLDGNEHVRITTSPLNHSVSTISPDHRFVVAVRQQADTPPESVVYEAASGKEVAKLTESSMDIFKDEGISAPELFSFMANDGKTKIWGVLHKPTNFDPNKKYPLLIDVYGGPGSRGISNRFNPVNPTCEMGYLIAKIGNRGTVGRGKAFESATYLSLGISDLDDQADGVKFLSQRPYVDGDRVGIYGHSYGGYMSALALLRYPDVFHVGVSGAPVTDWKNYDSIYTERYMRTPQENADGYKMGSCETYVKNLKGNLLLVHGLVDDNVHPSNTWQLIKQLQDANQRFDLMVYPGYAHGVGSTYRSLRWEYFYKHLRPDQQ